MPKAEQTGQRYAHCASCDRRVIYSPRLRRWLHVRPDARWHKATVTKG